MRIAIAVLVLAVAGCVGPSPHGAVEGDVVVADVVLKHPAGPVLVSFPTPVTFDGRTVLGDHEVELLGATPGDTLRYERPQRGTYTFTPDPGLDRPLELVSILVENNVTRDEYHRFFGFAPPVVGSVNESTLPRPVEIPRRVVENATLTGQAHAALVGDRIIVSEMSVLTMQKWVDGRVVSSQTEIRREYDATDDPRYAMLDAQNRSVVLPVDEAWVVLRFEVDHGDRFPYGALGGWLAVDVRDGIMTFRLEPVVGLIFPAFAEGTGAARLDPLGLGTGSYQVIAVEDGVMKLARHQAPWAFLDAQDLVVEVEVAAVQKPAVEWDGVLG